MALRGPHFANVHQGLIKFGFVVHCFIDGFSRYIVGIRVHDNNRASSILDLFLSAVRKHGLPSRVRGDHGTENLHVATYMENHRGLWRGSYIWGRSVSHCVLITVGSQCVPLNTGAHKIPGLNGSGEITLNALVKG